MLSFGIPSQEIDSKTLQGRNVYLGKLYFQVAQFKANLFSLLFHTIYVTFSATTRSLKVDSFTV